MGFIKENFMSIPIRLYDEYSLMGAELKETEEIKNSYTSEPKFVPSTLGLAMIRPKSIVGWADCASRNKHFDEIDRDGFDSTSINVLEGNALMNYECSWSRKKFEEKLDEFMESQKLLA